MPPPLRIRHLGRSDYQTTWQAMQAYTAQRDAASPDELWLTEHAPVYTLGLNRRDAHPPLRNDIPLLPVDRGGKITYHGPGQVVIYLLIDLKRRDWRVRQLVGAMEEAMIALDDAIFSAIGPTGRPPRGCCSSYFFQSVFTTASVMPQAPRWKSSGTRFAKR